MDASWTPFIAAAGFICAVFSTAVWRQSRRRASAAVGAADSAPMAAVVPQPAPAPPPVGNVADRRAALERMLAAAPMPIGSWEDTAPLTVPPDEVAR